VARNARIERQRLFLVEPSMGMVDIKVRKTVTREREAGSNQLAYLSTLLTPGDQRSLVGRRDRIKTHQMFLEELAGICGYSLYDWFHSIEPLYNRFKRDVQLFRHRVAMLPKHCGYRTIEQAGGRVLQIPERIHEVTILL
jgi:hypothetical protein